jgi:hypothetical protein
MSIDLKDQPSHYSAQQLLTNLHPKLSILGGEKVRYVCRFPLQIKVCFIFYEGTTADGSPLNDEKFEMLCGDHIYIVRRTR